MDAQVAVARYLLQEPALMAQRFGQSRSDPASGKASLKAIAYQATGLRRLRLRDPYAGTDLPQRARPPGGVAQDVLGARHT